MSRLNFLGPANVAESTAPLAKHTFTTEGTGFSLTLKLRSFATDARASPLFVSNVPISGKVKLDVSQPLKASSVVLTIRGFERGTLAEAFPSPSAFNSAHERNFLEHKVVLWSSSHSPSKRLEAREHRFTFRELLPATINSRDGQTVPLPPTFTGDNCPVFTLYDVSVVIQRGFLQRDERVDTSIRVVTRSQPPPPSALMRRAHEIGTLLPGPHADGAGWLTKAVSLHLRTPRQHVELRCQCAVAAPASHPRGYPIPLWLTTHSLQPQALAATSDLLLRGGVSVQLIRSIRWHRDALPVTAAPDVVVAQANFWRIPSPDANKKMLQGEVLPPATLPPSFAAPNFELQYTLSFAFQPSLRDAGIHFDDEPVSLPVQITSNPSAVRPRSYAP